MTSVAGAAAAFVAYALVYRGRRGGAALAAVVAIALWTVAEGAILGPIAAVTSATAAASVIVLLAPVRPRWIVRAAQLAAVIALAGVVEVLRAL